MVPTLPTTAQYRVSVSTRGSPNYLQNLRIRRAQRRGFRSLMLVHPSILPIWPRPSRIIPASLWTSCPSLEGFAADVHDSRESFLKPALPSTPVLHKSSIHKMIGSVGIPLHSRSGELAPAQCLVTVLTSLYLIRVTFVRRGRGLRDKDENILLYPWHGPDLKFIQTDPVEKFVLNQWISYDESCRLHTTCDYDPGLTFNYLPPGKRQDDL